MLPKKCTTGALEGSTQGLQHVKSGLHAPKTWQWQSPGRAHIRIYSRQALKRVTLINGLSDADPIGRVLDFKVYDARSSPRPRTNVILGFDTREELDRLGALIKGGYGFGVNPSGVELIYTAFHASRRRSWEFAGTTSSAEQPPARELPSRVLCIVGPTDSSILNKSALEDLLVEGGVEAQTARFIIAHDDLKQGGQRSIIWQFCDWASEARLAFSVLKKALKDIEGSNVTYGFDPCDTSYERKVPSTCKFRKVTTPYELRKVISPVHSWYEALPRATPQKSDDRSRSIGNVHAHSQTRSVDEDRLEGKIGFGNKAYLDCNKKVDLQPPLDAEAQPGDRQHQAIKVVLKKTHLTEKEETRLENLEMEKLAKETLAKKQFENERLQKEKLEKELAEARDKQQQRELFAHPGLDSWIRAIAGDTRRQAEEKLLFQNRKAPQATLSGLLHLGATPPPARLQNAVTLGLTTKSVPIPEADAASPSTTPAGPSTAMTATSLSGS